MYLVKLREVMPFKFRVGPKTKSGNYAVLGYIDARDCMNHLDKVIGPANWSRSYYTQKDNLFCSVGLKIENERIYKDDCGTESATAKAKGEASDAFKRACVGWGLGRFTYSLPMMYITGDEYNKNKYKVTRFVKTKFRSELIARAKEFADSQDWIIDEPEEPQVNEDEVIDGFTPKKGEDGK